MGRTLRGLSLGLVALLLLIGFGGCGKGSGPKLSGSGSTFVKPIMDKWIDVYSQERGDYEINYQGQGSTAGIKQMTEKAVQFGCTDAFMTEEQLQKARAEGGEVVHIPLVMGGVVPAYNLPGIDRPLNFRGEVLADIFNGDITRWNEDDRLKEDNPGVKLPDLKISVVHRADPSGTTAIFTEFLSTVSPKWKGKAGTAVDWRVGSGESGNPAVADNIGHNPGSIGYVELLFALQKKEIKYGAVKNKAGRFILANESNVSAAANSLKKVPDDLRFSLVKECEGKDAYPVSGTTWAVLYQRQPGEGGRELVKFLSWVVHDGQQYARDMHYAPLPELLIKRIDEKLQSIKLD